MLLSWLLTGLDRVILEGDSKVVTQALETEEVGLAAYGLLIRDACTLARNFSEVSYSHTKRKGNKVAHGLAKLAANLADCVIWMEEVPPFINHFVQANLAPPFSMIFESLLPKKKKKVAMSYG